MVLAATGRERAKSASNEIEAEALLTVGRRTVRKSAIFRVERTHMVRPEIV
jgi:hypothetical protein